MAHLFPTLSLGVMLAAVVALHTVDGALVGAAPSA